MKKWEQEKNQRLHQKKLQAAKSSVNTNVNKLPSDLKSPSNLKSQLSSNYSNFQSPPRSISNDLSRVSHSSQISDYYDTEKSDPTSIPLYKLLKHHGLQQYAKVYYYCYILSKNVYRH